MEDIIEGLVDKLFEQKGKLIWLMQQNPVSDEQKRVIEVAGEKLEIVNRTLGELGYGLPG